MPQSNRPSSNADFPRTRKGIAVFLLFYFGGKLAAVGLIMVGIGFVTANRGAEFDTRGPVMIAVGLLLAAAGTYFYEVKRPATTIRKSRRESAKENR